MAEKRKSLSTLRYLREYALESALGPLFKLAEAGLELIVPLVIAGVVDTGIGAHDGGAVVSAGLQLVALAAIGLACSVTAQYFAAKASVGLATALRRDLFAHVQRLSWADLDRVGTSTLITRLTSDVNQIQTGVNLALRLYLRAPVVVFGSMIMAFTIDVPAALIFTVVIPTLAAVVFGIMLASIPLYRRVQERLDRVTLLTRENLAGVRVIRAFGRERQERASFERATGTLRSAQLFVGRISALMNPLTYVIINAGVVALLWTGAVRVDAGGLTQGAVVALVNYLTQILVELVKLADLIITTTKAVACNRRVKAVLAIEPALEQAQGEKDRAQGLRGYRPARSSAAEGSAVSGASVSAKLFEHGMITPEAPGEPSQHPGTAPAVEFDHVSLTYPAGQAPALEDICMRLMPGQTLGIIGSTGSGKSSLVNLVPRFYDATGGQVRVLGRPVKDYDLPELRAKVGVVPQRAVLFRGTLADNLRWGNPQAAEADLWHALDLAQARDFVEKLPAKLKASVSAGGSNFSGGQRQRLCIARALVRKPAILILDDSASALDYATDARLRAALRTLPADTSVIVISQRTASVRHADLIAVMENGRTVGLGTHDELLRTCPVYQEIHASQFGDAGQDGKNERASAATRDGARKKEAADVRP